MITLLGFRTTQVSPSIIKDFIQSYLERKKRENEIQDFTPEDVQVIVEGKEARISMTVFPIRDIEKNYCIIGLQRTTIRSLI